MKASTAAKRLHLVLTPSDLFSIKQATEYTYFTTKSDVIREALRLLCQLRKNHSRSLRVVLRNSGIKQQYPVSLFAPTTRAATNSSEPGCDVIPSTEVRLPVADSAELDRLKAEGPGETQIQIVRQAIKVYADIVEKVSAGWRLGVSSKEDVFVECPVSGLRASPLSDAVTEAPDQQSTEEQEWPALLPTRLVKAVEEAAEKEGSRPEQIAADILREFISKRRPINNLALPPHTLEHLIAFHEGWCGESLLVSVRELLDADTFFPLLLQHLRNNVQTFYLHSDLALLDQIEQKLNNLPADYREDVQNCFHWIQLPPAYLAGSPELVIFDPLIRDKANGYIWLGGRSPCYEAMGEPQLKKALREYTPLLEEAARINEGGAPNEAKLQPIVLDPYSLQPI